MKYPYIGMTFIFMLVVGCSINSPKHKLDLIQMDSNFISNEMQLSAFLKRLDALKTSSKSDTVPLRILHIGDSHVQMGHFSKAIREGLQEEFGGSELGFFFPYNLCGGYNPPGINVTSNSSWKCATNSKPDSTFDVGITGATAQTIDSISKINFAFKGRTKIKTVQIYHQNLTDQFMIRCKGAIVETIVSSNFTEFTTITLSEEANEIEVEIVELNKLANHLSIYGISMNQLESEGIDYHSFGVSGNQYQFFATLSPLFNAQLKDFNPDLVIISLGSNDAYRKGVDSIQYRDMVNAFVKTLRQTAPNSAYILTSPLDTKYKNERPASEKIILNSIRHAVSVNSISEWDFHTLMGGFESNNRWQKLDLAGEDGLHLTNQGYQIEGLLFNIALAKALKNKYPHSPWLKKTEHTYQQEASKINGF